MSSEQSIASWPSRQAEPDALKDACLQAHSAVQWLARIVNCHGEGGEDRLLMQWEPERGAVVTRAFADGTSVEMRLPELVLQFREGGTPTRYPVTLDDKSPAEVEAWTLIELYHRHLDNESFSRDLPYETADLLSGDAPHFQTVDREAAFEDLADWLRLADDLLREVAGRADGAGGAPVLRPSDFALFTETRGHEIGFAARGGEQGPGFYVGGSGGERAVLTTAEIVEAEMGRDQVLAFLEERLPASDA